MANSLPDAPQTTGRVLHWAARYDLLVWLLTHGRPGAFREKLAGLARLVPGESVLDIGYGTGSLAIVAKQMVGATGEVFGIDASPEMIARATRKGAHTGTAVSFTTAVAESLPFPDDRFDVVLSTLMLHHLPRPVPRLSASSPVRTGRSSFWPASWRLSS
jgi:ubiquinone/menaquinone biosynthesis C-methylase UbiE